MLRKPLTVAAEAELAVSAAPAAEAVLVDVVVLTADPELFQAARDAVGERSPVVRPIWQIIKGDGSQSD